MIKGVFIDFPLAFLENGNGGLSNGDQALTIEAAARLLVALGHPVVAITYSANEDQTKALVAAYAQNQYAAGINGLHQAEVMAAQEADLGTKTASDLQMKLRIAPITTILTSSTDQSTVIQADLKRCKSQLDQGWAILGWQNQSSVKDTVHPYAIGGGVALGLPAAIVTEIQSGLINLRTDYPMTPGSMPSPWPPSLH